jgi:hypothetical protein
MARFTVLALLVFFIDFVVADVANVNEQEASLSHDVALLRQAVLTLQDTVRNQGVLITDLRQLNQQQEQRIQELETAQKIRDEYRELQKQRIQEQDTVRKQGVLITDLRQLNQQQEQRIQELETAQKIRDEYRELQEQRIQELEVAQKNRDEKYRQKYLESKFSSEDLVSSEDTEEQRTDQSTHYAMVMSEGTRNEKINRRGL